MNTNLTEENINSISNGEAKRRENFFSNFFSFRINTGSKNGGFTHGTNGTLLCSLCQEGKFAFSDHFNNKKFYWLRFEIPIRFRKTSVQIELTVIQLIKFQAKVACRSWETAHYHDMVFFFTPVLTTSN